MYLCKCNLLTDKNYYYYDHNNDSDTLFDTHVIANIQLLSLHRLQDHILTPSMEAKLLKYGSNKIYFTRNVKFI